MKVSIYLAIFHIEFHSTFHLERFGLLLGAHARGNTPHVGEFTRLELLPDALYGKVCCGASAKAYEHAAPDVIIDRLVSAHVTRPQSYSHTYNHTEIPTAWSTESPFYAVVPLPVPDMACTSPR